MKLTKTMVTPGWYFLADRQGDLVGCWETTLEFLTSFEPKQRLTRVSDWMMEADSGKLYWLPRWMRV